MIDLGTYKYEDLDTEKYTTEIFYECVRRVNILI